MCSLKHRLLCYLSLVTFLVLATVATTTNTFAATETGPTSVSATPVTLNGTNQTTTYTLPLSVDNTGMNNGNGWNLTITSTTLTAGSHTLANAASSIQSAPAVGGCTNSCPTNSVSYSPAITIPAGSTFPTAVKFFNAAAGTGKGTGITVTVTVTVAIPANTFQGSYTGTVNVAIASGP